MARKQMTAREEFLKTLLEEQMIVRREMGGLNVKVVEYFLYDYYISRKKPLKHKETPSERARRMTIPLEFKGAKVDEEGDPILW